MSQNNIIIGVEVLKRKRVKQSSRMLFVISGHYDTSADKASFFIFNFSSSFPFSSMPSYAPARPYATFIL